MGLPVLLRGAGLQVRGYTERENTTLRPTKPQSLVRAPGARERHDHAAHAYLWRESKVRFPMLSDRDILNSASDVTPDTSMLSPSPANWT